MLSRTAKKFAFSCAKARHSKKPHKGFMLPTVPGTEQRIKLEHENEYDFFSFVDLTDAFLLRRPSYICVMSRFFVTTYFFLLTNIPVRCPQIFLEVSTFALNVHIPCL